VNTKDHFRDLDGDGLLTLIEVNGILLAQSRMLL
jgi:hypothetical protein